MTYPIRASRLVTLLAFGALAACTAPESSPTGLAPSGEPAAARPVPSPYTMQELGSVADLPEVFAVDVNDQGVVAGYAIGETGSRGFLFLGGQVVTLTQSEDSHASGISNGDPMHVVGAVRVDGTLRSARWTVAEGAVGTPVISPVSGGASKVNDLGDGVGSNYIWRLDNSVVQVATPGDFQFITGMNINDAGLTLFRANGSPTSPDRAFLRLTDGRMIRLDPPAGRESYTTTAGGLTEPDGDGFVHVAGTIQIDFRTRFPTRWTVNAATQQVTVLVDDDLAGFSGDISSAGTTVGGAGRGHDTDAYAWRLDGTTVKLPAPRGSQDVAAVAISDDGRYATGGYYASRGGRRALLWSGDGP